MSFLRKLFRRSKQASQCDMDANARDLDSGYVFVRGLDDVDRELSGDHEVADNLVVEGHSTLTEDPSEVDVSAWEMARNWTAKTKSASRLASVKPAVSSKSQRLAHRVENIRRTPHQATTRNQKRCVVEYVDPAMDEDSEYLFDDKWNRKTKVESRRDRLSKLGT
ncbi:LAME_0H04016g1_1 [Lachancea meyersii CBS 8951]|uniref:LAME_0H04016g1_1 n=1 Tax=Lachancea meyersii CBS 8951 TaxID=1266667 RepID=A0A1G4KDS9_9SACH|nr:LAME_0H04016g1_1 [Lachancea meyersii CBS 8951]